MAFSSEENIKIAMSKGVLNKFLAEALNKNNILSLKIQDGLITATRHEGMHLPVDSDELIHQQVQYTGLEVSKNHVKVYGPGGKVFASLPVSIATMVRSLGRNSLLELVKDIFEKDLLAAEYPVFSD